MRRVLAIALLAPLVGMAQAPGPVSLPAATARLDTEFSTLASVRELSDGRVLLLDRHEERLVVADFANGTVRNIGRRGQGPGEYDVLVRLIALGGDSTLAPDTRRWLLLDGDSVVATLPPDTPAIRAVTLWPLGGDADGHVLTRHFARDGDSSYLALVDRATGRSDTVARLRVGVGRARARAVTGPDGRSGMQTSRIPLNVYEEAALFPDGWVAIARLEPYRVDWRAPDGQWIQGQRLPFRRVRMTQRQQRAYATRNTWAEYATDWPADLPPFDNVMPSSLVLAPDRMLLIRRLPNADQPETRYDIVDRRGAWRGQLVLPPNQHVLGFGAHAVYVVTTDDDGLQFLSRHAWPSPQLRG